jgi:3-methyladenine DNA glycosylase/8-oxoguanine DNA glycosylase
MSGATPQSGLSVSSTEELRERERRSLDRCGVSLGRKEGLRAVASKALARECSSPCRSAGQVAVEM